MNRQSDVQLDPKATLFLVLKRTFNPVYLLILILFLTSLLGKCHGTVQSTPSATHPALAGLAIGGFLFVGLLILFGGALLLQWLYCRALVRSCRIDLRDDGVSMKSGVFGTVSELLLYARIQDIVISNSVLERLLGLATVFVQNAAGRPISIWGLGVDTAERLRDLILAQVAVPKSGADFSREIDSAQLTSPTGASSQRSDGSGVVIIIAVSIALVLTAVIGPWRYHSSGGLPPTASTQSPTTPQSSGNDATSRRVPAAPAPAPASPQPAVAQQSLASSMDRYAAACSIHDSTAVDGVLPCSKFGEARRCDREADYASHPTVRPETLTIDNRSSEEVRVYWLTPSGDRKLYVSLRPGGHMVQPSHEGAYWLFASHDDRCVAIFSAATMAIGIF